MRRRHDDHRAAKRGQCRHRGVALDFIAELIVCDGVDFSEDDIPLIRGSEGQTVQVTMCSNKSLI
jgi:hypothetical protein